MDGYGSDTNASMIYGVGFLLVCVIFALACHLCCDRSEGQAAWFDARQSDVETAGIDPEESAALAANW